MRRSRNTGRGGGRDSLNMHGGPLLTEHLKDIDLELELLKRKREMIEQQQQQFLQPYKPQVPRNFNQQPYYRVQNEHSNASIDFSHLYTDGPQQQYRKPFAKKRQSDNDWQHDSYPKRSAGAAPRGQGYNGPPPVRNQRPFSGTNQQSKGFKYGQGKQSIGQGKQSIGQGKQSIGQRISNQKQQKPQKNFVPTKVTKPTATAAQPNKMAAKPVADRSELVAAAIKSVAAVENREREALRLLPHKVPTKQMTGRLELALGAILRDIRDKCAETAHEELLRTAAMQRVMKQAIRERIRTAMLGKVVGATVEIIKEYRTMFPKDTDIEIVNKALETASIAPEKTTKANNIVIGKERPDEFYKENMCTLIELHLQEMFNKIDEIYNPPEENQEQTPQKEGEVDFTQDVEPTATEALSQNQENAGTNNQDTEVATANPEEVSKTEEASKATDSGEAVKSATGGEANKNGKEDKKMSIDELVEKLKDSNPNDYKRLLPRLLKRHIPTIIKMLHVNKMYRSAVADLTATTRTKYVDYAKSQKPNMESEAPATTEAQTPAKFQPQPQLPYYVKVMGKPQLPKKKVMQAFLEIFHPKSIKKHRSIHNLLFIGFTEKADFDAIVEADGTVFGRSTLSIRVCDKNTNNKTEENAANDSAVTNANANQSLNETQNSTDSIGSELDGQISDLLSSIRNSEDAKDQDENAEGGEETGETGDSAENVTDNINEIVNEENQEQSEANGETEQSNSTEEQAQTEAEAQNNEEEAQKVENADDSAKSEIKDQVAELKSATGRATPTRASTRLTSAPSTPNSVRTRRASRLMQ